jgi:predicted short-subunit dehydrogenase-like oxidoreductase (DUF2520 family)
MKSQETTAIVGDGRLGRALTAALRSAGASVSGPHGRGFSGARAADGAAAPFTAILLCVPDAEIASAAAALDLRPSAAEAPLIGHCSGATPLTALGPHEAFGLHPLMTVTHDGADFTGAGAAVAGTTDRALRFATDLAHRLGLRPFPIDDGDRAAYHAGAAMAANYLITLEEAAARVAGIDRELLVPLVRAAVETWAVQGEAALTGPIARGDESTIAAHRQAIAERAPDLLELYDVLADATRQVATA